MSRLSRDQILSAPDHVSTMKTVEVPEWGGQVNVRVMTGKGRQRVEEEAKSGDNLNIVTCLLAGSLCDDEGKLIFSEPDIEALKDKSSAVLLRLYKTASDLNKIGSDAVEEAEKNS